MKLGELIVELGTKGNTKELEKTLKQLKEAEKKVSAQIKLNKDLAKAETEEEKSLIRKNHAQKQEIASLEKSINKNKERNKVIIDSIKGFTRLIGTISLAIGVLDRFANASAKTNQGILTTALTSGVSADTINKYASAARSVNYGVSREEVGQAFQSISEQLVSLRRGEDAGLIQGLNTLKLYGSKGDFSRLSKIGTNPQEFIELIRDWIKGVDDVYAARALSEMGISANLLPMLRMSSEEFSKVRNRFPSESQMKEEQKRSLELQEKRDELAKEWEKLLIDLYPVLNEISKNLIIIAPTIASIVRDITPILTDIAKALGPIFRWLNKTYKWATTPVKRKDLEFAQNLGRDFRNSLFLGQPNFAPTTTRAYSNNQTINQTFNNTVNTTQPGDAVTISNNLQQSQRGFKEVSMINNQGRRQ